jgi:quercetin dioxygenase-like cupin family protein
VLKERNRGDCALGQSERGGSGLTMETFNLLSGETDEGPSEAPGCRCRAARVGSKLGGSRLGMSVYDLPPGEAIGPYHFEWADEEWLIALEGQVTIRTPESELVLDPGEVVCFPAGPVGATRYGTQTTCQYVSRSSPRRTSSASSSTPKTRKWESGRERRTTCSTARPSSCVARLGQAVAWASGPDGCHERSRTKTSTTGGW